MSTKIKVLHNGTNHVISKKLHKICTMVVKYEYNTILSDGYNFFQFKVLGISFLPNLI